MQISKPALPSHGFWIVLAIAFCISIGILTGFHGGLHNEAGAIYDSSGGEHAKAGGEEIHLFGGFGLFGVVGGIELSPPVPFLSGDFVPRPEAHRSVPP